MPLPLDILEEFRAIFGDRLALTLINRGQLKASDFDEMDGGSVLLNDEGRKKVLTAYQERKKERPQFTPYLISRSRLVCCH